MQAQGPLYPRNHTVSYALSIWLSVSGRAQPKLAGPRPYLFYAWCHHWLTEFVFVKIIPMWSATRDTCQINGK